MSYTQKNYGIAPKPSRDDYPTYCNVLPPPPRDQHNIFRKSSSCPYLPPNPYSKDSCYLLEKNSQNVPGFFCGGNRGSGNLDFVRGGDFSVGYPYEKLSEQNYVVNSNGDKPSELLNNTIQSKSDFYPYPNQKIVNNIDYKSYPNHFMYSQNGKQLYTYPYKKLN